MSDFRWPNWFNRTNFNVLFLIDGIEKLNNRFVKNLLTNCSLCLSNKIFSLILSSQMTWSNHQTVNFVIKRKIVNLSRDKYHFDDIWSKCFSTTICLALELIEICLYYFWINFSNKKINEHIKNFSWCITTDDNKVFALPNVRETKVPHDQVTL